ncbi:GNAT family N-acetyltransferase [Mesorhizobium xinjiangense]|uniref:GNAT family N-acetyltransferase n=1 Tax=Mesorhizobium xinjiangense TaxID=2678685 RepID=UPI0012ED2266|nr:N-acetyltransferase [Mesorhizobium xinjiangense]
MNDFAIRPALAADRDAIFQVEAAAFGRRDEAELVEQIVADGDAVLELVALAGDVVIGHILFSRLTVEGSGEPFAAVALAPLAVVPDHQGRGVGGALIGEAHRILPASGERLSIVLGDPGYYGRFGYDRARATGFDSYQGDALQALAWGDAPTEGRLVYPRAFGE